MDLYEYQAKDLFGAHGVPVLPGSVADTPDEARRIAADLGQTVVVKAQVKTGGRGKAGGVKLADDPADAEDQGRGESSAWTSRATSSAACWSRPPLTSPRSTTSPSCWTAPTARSSRWRPLRAAWTSSSWPSSARTRWPRCLIDPLHGVDLAKAKDIVDRRQLPRGHPDQAAEVVVKLWETFVAEDATLVEVNPLVRDPQDKIIALDGKVTLDENAAFRHPDHADLVDTAAEDPLEAAAKAKDLNYVKLDGQVGIIGNGAGLVMSTLDVVAYAGEEFGGMKPANFLDIGGGASAEVMANGLEIILGDRDVRSVFVNVFGGITACDAVANGIVQAFQLLEAAASP